jgi:hypothetical protein
MAADMDCGRRRGSGVCACYSGALKGRRSAAGVADQVAEHGAAQAGRVKGSKQAAAGDRDVLARVRDFTHKEEVGLVPEKPL